MRVTLGAGPPGKATLALLLSGGVSLLSVTIWRSSARCGEKTQMLEPGEPAPDPRPQTPDLLVADHALEISPATHQSGPSETAGGHPAAPGPTSPCHQPGPRRSSIFPLSESHSHSLIQSITSHLNRSMNTSSISQVPEPECLQHCLYHHQAYRYLKNELKHITTTNNPTFHMKFSIALSRV